MKPIAFQRTDDGELFTLDKGTGQYSIEANKREFPLSKITSWPESELTGLAGFREIYDEALLSRLLKERFK